MSNAYKDLLNSYAVLSTGTAAGATASNRTQTFSFDQYEIVVAVTEDNKVIGIVEVRQKQDFRDVKQKIASTGYVDIERFATE